MLGTGREGRGAIRKRVAMVTESVDPGLSIASSVPALALSTAPRLEAGGGSGRLGPAVRARVYADDLILESRAIVRPENYFFAWPTARRTPPFALASS